MDLKKSLFILPNLFTLAGMLCGLYAISLCVHPDDGQGVGRATIFIIYAMLLDMLDGRVARLTRTQSSFGLQFDSLADLVSFGVAPSILIYRWSLAETGPLGLATCFLFTACGALRLARFNVISLRAVSGSSTSAIHTVGLPIPTAAGFLVSLVIANQAIGSAIHEADKIVMGIMAVLAVLMVSTMRFRSFKNLRPSVFNIGVVVIAIASSLLLWIRFRPALILIWLISFYIAIGLAETLIHLGRRSRAGPDRKAVATQDAPPGENP